MIISRKPLISRRPKKIWMSLVAVFPRTRSAKTRSPRCALIWNALDVVVGHWKS